MKKSITILPVGTKFVHDGLEYQVTSREEYPFIMAKCLTEPNDYEGHEVMFWNYDQVEVPDDTRTYKQTFVEVGKNYFAMKEELV